MSSFEFTCPRTQTQCQYKDHCSILKAVQEREHDGVSTALGQNALSFIQETREEIHPELLEAYNSSHCLEERVHAINDAVKRLRFAEGFNLGAVEKIDDQAGALAGSMLRDCEAL